MKMGKKQTEDKDRAKKHWKPDDERKENIIDASLRTSGSEKISEELKQKKKYNIGHKGTIAHLEHRIERSRRRS